MDLSFFLGLLAFLLLLSPLLLVLYALLTDDPYRGHATALPSDYRPEANHPRRAATPGQCSNCGTENDVAYDFCRGCGSKLDAEGYERTASPERTLGSE